MWPRTPLVLVSGQSWAEDIRTEQGGKAKLTCSPFKRPDLADLLRPYLSGEEKAPG